MKRKLLTMAVVAVILFFSGCYPDGAEYYEDTDIVYSVYDQKFDFQNKGTYSLADKIVKITGDDEGEIEYIKDIYAQPTLAQIDKNMQAMGWTKVNKDQNPDVEILPAAWSTTTVFYWGYWGDYWCWWDPYYCGGGWYYPYYPTYSSYTTGTLVMTMTDPKNPATDDSRKVVWTSAINGLYQGTYNASRINKAIDQAFIQSPYLKTN